ncbi:probable enoyl-[acyl-carrier-protein] reductase 1 [Rhynchosporium agropyri]|uniref:Probable enoyl-[acyl-carrier-protein] reductase 1 n=1 Tax=Rhynchosporium agropyri TaxID=914238 RepID=A0A1E1K0Z5_9HELO|nr:probable enoyl-[acyl-carrier-protein] reductase 1 [Rhynchosporium agropyri]
MATQKYNKLAGKHVLIIGGTSGIGYAVAEGSIESGASVTVSSSNPSRVQSSISSLQTSYPSAQVSGHACDLSTTNLEADIEALFEKTGKVDHVVFTAGDGLAQMKVEDITLEKIVKAGQIRFFAPLLVAKVATKYLNPGPGSSIVFTTGAVADKPIANWSVVASYAAGLHGMTRNLALDLKPIRVNLVSPGAIDTELWKGFSEDQKKAFFKVISDKLPTGKVGKPEDVAETYLWLMKDTNVTGFVASSNGGDLLV